jgi:hypothetical protein
LTDIRRLAVIVDQNNIVNRREDRGGFAGIGRVVFIVGKDDKRIDEKTEVADRYQAFPFLSIYITELLRLTLKSAAVSDIKPQNIPLINETPEPFAFSLSIDT